jgi:hypothetical protein
MTWIFLWILLSVPVAVIVGKIIETPDDYDS